MISVHNFILYLSYLFTDLCVGILIEAVEEIKQAMSGFSLPSSSIPQWAKQVPEDVWKNELIKGLQERKQK